MNLSDETLLRDSDLVERLRRYDAGHRIGAPGSRQVFVSQLLEAQAERDLKGAQITKLPRDTRRRAIIREVIEGEGANPQNLRHIHSVLALCGLPYTRQPLDVREYHRKQGRMSLIVKAGELWSPDAEWVPQPLPYGSRARLLLLHLCSEAVRQKSATIEIEDSLTAFLRAMGYPATGGPRGTLTAFKQQVNALAACNMKIGTWDGAKSTTINTSPFSSIDVWFPADPDQRILWPSTVTFSREFFDTLAKHALPVSTHAVKAFAGSPRKIDLYFWLSYRLNSINDPLRITWEGLKEQFGAGYDRDRAFRAQFAEEIGHLKEVFPKLPAKLTADGLTLLPADPSTLAIPAKRSTKKA